MELAIMGDISDPAEIEAYQAPGKANIKRQYSGEEHRAFKQFRAKCGGWGTKNWIPENDSEFGENGRGGAKFGRATCPLSESRWS